MARLGRAEVFSPTEIAICHVMSRVVRRCFLLGDDPVTGKNYDHRKQWIEDQLILLINGVRLPSQPHPLGALAPSNVMRLHSFSLLKSAESRQRTDVAHVSTPDPKRTEESDSSVVTLRYGTSIELLSQRFQRRMFARKQHLHDATFDRVDVEHGSN